MKKYIVPIIVGVAIAFLVNLGFAMLDAAIVRRTGTSAGLGFTWWIGPGLGVFVAFIMANLAGNRKSVMADKGTTDTALAMSPPPGQALIYVMRRGLVGMAAGLNVSVNGKVLVQLKSPRFSYFVVPPGRYTLEAAFGGLAGPQNKPSAVEVILEAGDVAVYDLDLKMGALRNTIAVNHIRDLAAARQAMTGVKMAVAEPLA